jgi:hypothetical protein
MTNKSFNQEDSTPFDYFADEKSVQKQEAVSVEHVISNLREDMLPASEALPASKNIFQRINYMLIGGIFIVIIIIGILTYLLAGSGRSILEKSLAGLVSGEGTPTQKISPTQLLTTDKPPEASKTPLVSPTSRPTKTQAMVIIASPTLIPTTLVPNVTITPDQSESTTSALSCRDALSITMAEVGQTLCVEGIIKETVANPTYFMVIFNTARGSFYWVTYDLIWSKGEVNKCYRVNGTIDHIGSSPVLLFSYNNLPEECP